MTNPWDWRPNEPAYSRQSVSLIRLDGADTRRFLHGQTSAAIEQAPAGRWISTCCISPTARLRALAEVLVDDSGAWLALTAGDGLLVRQGLDRVLFPADQVRLGEVQPGTQLTAVAGHGETLPPSDAEHWHPLADNLGWQLGGGPLGQSLLLREPEPLPSTLPAAWAARRQLSPPEQEHWRLQLGLPAEPGELNDNHNPFELGLASRVSLSKGCYVGQETLAKLATYDGVKQHLRRWHWSRTSDVTPPELGQSLGDLASAGSEGAASGSAGTRLGRISSLLELENGDCIGLALVRRQALGLSQLQAGEERGGAILTLSRPERFGEPPVGAGR